MDIVHIMEEIYNLKFTKACVTVKISVITNLCLEPYFSKLLYLELKKIDCKTKINYFNILDIAYPEKTEKLFSSDVIVIFVNYEQKYDFKFHSNNMVINEIIDDSVNFIKNIEKHFAGKLIWVSYEDFYKNNEQVYGNLLTNNDNIDYINYVIHKKIPKNIISINLKNLMSQIGKNYCFDYNFFCKWGNPYSFRLLSFIVNEIVYQFRKAQKTNIKCIVLDCDNVLWGGVLSDIGCSGIILGHTYRGYLYQKFQYLLLEMYKRGIILALCSKNNVEDVLQVFQTNENMILKLEHIAEYKINWFDKSQNISELSKELKIDYKNIAFIDDSEYEINIIRKQLPEVTTVHFDINTIFENMKICHLGENVDVEEAQLRTQTYQSNKYRKNVLSESTSIKEYLDSIENRCTIKKSVESELKRISELSNRTNRMSSHRRYTYENLRKQLKHNSYKLYSVYVSDKFGDLGLVGCIGIDSNKNNLDLFCLSCRALGRTIEQQMIEFVVHNYKIEQIFFEKDSTNFELFNLFKNKFEIGISVQFTND